MHLLRESGAAFGETQAAPAQSGLALQPGLASPGTVNLLRPSRWAPLLAEQTEAPAPEVALAACRASDAGGGPCLVMRANAGSNPCRQAFSRDGASGASMVPGEQTMWYEADVIEAAMQGACHAGDASVQVFCDDWQGPGPQYHAGHAEAYGWPCSSLELPSWEADHAPSVSAVAGWRESHGMMDVILRALEWIILFGPCMHKASMVTQALGIAASH